MPCIFRNLNSDKRIDLIKEHREWDFFTRPHDSLIDKCVIAY